MNNRKYHYLPVTKPNALLANFLSKRDGDRYCLNCLSNFETDEKRKQHQKACKYHNHIEVEIPKKFE